MRFIVLIILVIILAGCTKTVRTPASGSSLSCIDSMIKILAVNDVLKLQKKLQAKGIITEPSFFANSHYVLKIVDVEPPTKFLKAKPSANMFKTAEFRKFLDSAYMENGEYIIDPSMSPLTGAVLYRPAIFSNSKLLDTSDANWVMGVRPNTPMSFLIHERVHYEDLVVNRKLDPIFDDPSDYSKMSDRRKKLFNKGRMTLIQNSLFSEINATNAQFRFFWETKSFPIHHVLHTIFYQGYNRTIRQYARILIDPKDPKNYILLFYGGVQTIFHPVLVAGGATVAGVYVIFFTEKSLGDDSSDK